MSSSDDHHRRRTLFSASESDEDIWDSEDIYKGNDEDLSPWQRVTVAAVNSNLFFVPHTWRVFIFLAILSVVSLGALCVLRIGLRNNGLADSSGLGRVVTKGGTTFSQSGERVCKGSHGRRNRHSVHIFSCAERRGRFSPNSHAILRTKISRGLCFR